MRTRSFCVGRADGNNRKVRAYHPAVILVDIVAKLEVVELSQVVAVHQAGLLLLHT